MFEIFFTSLILQHLHVFPVIVEFPVYCNNFYICTFTFSYSDISKMKWGNFHERDLVYYFFIITVAPFFMTVDAEYAEDYDI